MQHDPKWMHQTVLICGATGRVGSGIATHMASLGAAVAVHYNHNQEAANRLVDAIKASGGQAMLCQADLTHESSVKHLVADVQQSFGSIHVLVNAVHGQFDPKPVADMSWSDWSVHLDALKGHFVICRSVLSVMRQQHYGRIIYISGGLSRRYYSGCSAYTTIKAGLNGFCKTLALEEGCHGITVNIVAPGKVVPTDGRESTDNPQMWEEMNKQSLINNPLGRHATAEDVARAVACFASPDASGITGQTLYVAGGEIMP